MAMLFIYRIIFFIFLALLFSYVGNAFTSVIFQLIEDIRFIGIEHIRPDDYLNLFADRILDWEAFYHYARLTPNIYAAWVAVAVVGQLLVNNPFQFIFLMTILSSIFNLAIYYSTLLKDKVPQEFTELFSFPYTSVIAAGLIALFLSEKRHVPLGEINRKEGKTYPTQQSQPQPKKTTKNYKVESQKNIRTNKSADLSKIANKTSAKVIQQKTAPRDNKTLSID